MQHMIDALSSESEKIEGITNRLIYLQDFLFGSGPPRAVANPEEAAHGIVPRIQEQVERLSMRVAIAQSALTQLEESVGALYPVAGSANAKPC